MRPRTDTRDVRTPTLISGVALLGGALWGLLMLLLVLGHVGADAERSGDGYVVAPGVLGRS